MFEEYKKWNGKKAAELTNKLRGELDRIWPEHKHTVLALCHDNDRCFTSAVNKDAEAEDGFELFRMPVRSPELMPLDYSHWRWILNDMQAQEDRKGWTNHKETPSEYIQRLRATAFRMPKPHIDRAHACMMDHIELMRHHKGGHWEDGRKAVRRWRESLSPRTHAQREEAIEGLKGRNGKVPLWIRKVWREHLPSGDPLKEPLRGQDPPGGAEGEEEEKPSDSSIPPLLAGLAVAGLVSGGAASSPEAPSPDGPPGKKRRNHWSRSPKLRGYKPASQVGQPPQPGKPSPTGKQPEVPPPEEPSKKKRRQPLPPPDPGPEPPAPPAALVREDLGGGRVRYTRHTETWPTQNRRTGMMEVVGAFIRVGARYFRQSVEVRLEGHDEIPVPGDGSCLFHAIGFHLPPGWDATNLRGRVASLVRDGIPPGEPVAGETLATWVRAQFTGATARERSIPARVTGRVRPDTPIERVREVYVEWLLEVRRDGSYKTWGGPVEIAVAAHAFGLTVHVHHPVRVGRSTVFQEVEVVGSGGTRVNLIHRGGSHYNFLAPS
jgi:hypothetical protein